MLGVGVEGDAGDVKEGGFFGNVARVGDDAPCLIDEEPEVQEEIWKDAPWAFLVTEKLLYATSKKLTGMYVMPDANYFFEEIDLQ